MRICTAVCTQWKNEIESITKLSNRISTEKIIISARSNKDTEKRALGLLKIYDLLSKTDQIRARKILEEAKLTVRFSSNLIHLIEKIGNIELEFDPKTAEKTFYHADFRHWLNRSTYGRGKWIGFERWKIEQDNNLS